MLGWALTFFIIALLAAFLGMGSVAVLSAEIARLLFIMFIVLFLVSIVVGGVRRAAHGQVP